MQAFSVTANALADGRNYGGLREAMDGNCSNSESKSSCGAVGQLKEDQCAIRGLFADYEKASDFKKKEEIFSTISMALSTYAAMEGDVVYPSLKEKAEEQCDKPCSGEESHHQAKLVMDQLGRLTADVDAPAYDKAVQELKSIVEKHFNEEEKNLFPAIEKCSEKAEMLDGKVKAFKAEHKLQLSQK